jgi:transcriptional regulator with XRE-family HTH domain
MFNIRLRELREFKKLTQADVAEILQITREAYAMYESNKRQMNYESLCILADFFGVTTDYMLGRNVQDLVLLSETEKKMISKYRIIDERGQENIRSTLDTEYARFYPEGESEKLELDAIWDRILRHEGKQFFTKTKLPFTYKVIGNNIVPDRTDYPLAKTNFKKALQYMPLQSPNQINNIVRGPAYVYAILTDKRIIEFQK